MSKLKLLSAAAAVAALAALPAQALEQRPMLTLDLAMEMAEACVARAAEEGWRPIIVAVLDSGGNLKYFSRMEDAFTGSIDIALLKANTSALFQRSSRAMGELAFANPERPHGIELVPGIATFAGGLPITSGDGHHLGGIGVSGATADEDEMCAQAGIDAVADRLN